VSTNARPHSPLNQRIAPGGICWASGVGRVGGLELRYYPTETGIEATWYASVLYENQEGRLHNGLSAALLEDVSRWAVVASAYAESGHGVGPPTVVELHVTFLAPVPSAVELTLSARVSRRVGDNVQTCATLSGPSGALAEACGLLRTAK
jgi:hypothetical protein